MSNMPWFRSYSEILSDRKIVRICRITNQPKVIVVGLWITLLALANDSPERGKLLLTKGIPYSIDDIIAESEIPKEDVIKLLDAFRGMDMINGKNIIEISNWKKRQFKSDDGTKRVQAFRERQKETLQDTPDETLQERSEAVIEQNRTEHTKDIEVEKDNININEENKKANSSKSKIWKLLLSYGIDRNLRVEQIVNKPHMNPEYLRSHVKALERKGYNMPQYAGMLVLQLETGVDPGHEDGCQCEKCLQEYTNGEYSKYIEH